MLHELVAQHAQTMFAELRDADPEGGGLPRYVERELAAYLRCRGPPMSTAIRRSTTTESRSRSRQSAMER